MAPPKLAGQLRWLLYALFVRAKLDGEVERVYPHEQWSQAPEDIDNPQHRTTGDCRGKPEPWLMYRFHHIKRPAESRGSCSLGEWSKRIGCTNGEQQRVLRLFRLVPNVPHRLNMDELPVHARAQIGHVLAGLVAPPHRRSRSTGQHVVEGIFKAVTCPDFPIATCKVPQLVSEPQRRRRRNKHSRGGRRRRRRGRRKRLAIVFGEGDLQVPQIALVLRRSHQRHEHEVGRPE